MLKQHNLFFIISKCWSSQNNHSVKMLANMVNLSLHRRPSQPSQFFCLHKMMVTRTLYQLNTVASNIAKPCKRMNNMIRGLHYVLWWKRMLSSQTCMNILWQCELWPKMSWHDNLRFYYRKLYYVLVIGWLTRTYI